jgi:hypothetical protein
MKEIKEDTKNGNNSYNVGIISINVVKMSISSNVVYRFNAIPLETSMAFLTEIEKTSLNSYGTKNDPK